MKVHITNVNGQHYRSVAQIAQNMVAQIARNNFHWDEFTIYNYDTSSETPESLVQRFDGMIGALNSDDIVIFQSPSWNSIMYDTSLLQRCKAYPGVKTAIFIHDIVPLMFEQNRYLMGNFINFYNMADLVIVPTRQMLAELRRQGMVVEKVVIQEFWDHVCSVDPTVVPHYEPLISFIGDVEKFDFVKNWDNDDVKLLLTAPKQAFGNGKNIEFVGWQDDPVLLSTLRSRGGFGLVWGEEPYWREYMKLNASYKLSTYLAAGLPVLIGPDTPQRDVIEQKNLGIVVESLEDAAEKVKALSAGEYEQKMLAVNQFAELIRGGYFTKRLLAETIFQLLH